MTIKISLFFQGNEQTCGWSETLYFTGTDLGAASDAVVALWPLRLAVAPSSVEALGGRASVIGTRKKAKLLSQPAAHTGTFNGEDDMTEPWSALLLKLSHGFQLTVNKFLHGIPQTQVTGGIYTPTGGFTTALNAYLDAVRDGFVLWAADPAVIGAPKQQWSCDGAEASKLTSHRVGRPFGLLVGRRLA